MSQIGILKLSMNLPRTDL